MPGRLELAATIIPSVLSLAVALVPLFSGTTHLTTLAQQQNSATVQYIGPSNPLLIIADANRELKLTAQIGRSRYQYIRTWAAILHNTGQSAIRPIDVFDPIQIEVDSPWRILSIVNGLPHTAQIVEPEWRRMSPTSFTAGRPLMNPGDQIWATVYLGRSNLDVPDAEVAGPNVRYEAHIANLPAFTTFPGPTDPTFLAKFNNRNWGIFSDLSGWGVWFALAATSISLVAYLLLLKQLNWLLPWRFLSYILVIGSMLLALCSSEAVATYLYGSVWTISKPTSFWLNAPPIFANVTALTLLSTFAVFRPRYKKDLAI